MRVEHYGATSLRAEPSRAEPSPPPDLTMPKCGRGRVLVVGLVALCACDGTAPNLAPVAVGTIPAQTTKVADSTTLDVAVYFNDPDGDPLTYSAASSDINMATASVTGSILTIGGVAAGEAAVKITATDPGGLTAAQNASVVVTAPFLRYDFNSDADLYDWRTQENTFAQVRAGNLEVSNTETDWLGLVWQPLDTTLSDWEVSVRMARTETNVKMIVWLTTTHEVYTDYRFEIGSGVEIDDQPTNYRLLAWDTEWDDGEGDWVYFTDGAGWGWSDEIADAADEFSVLKWSVIGGRLRIRSNGTLIHQHDLGDWRPSEIRGIGLASGSTDRLEDATTLFDWVTLERESR